MFRRALVTGASSGIGEEFAKQLHNRNYSVVLVARRVERLLQLAQQLNQQRPDSALVLQADLLLEDGCKRVENYIRTNEVHLLVNNAGRGSFGYFEEIALQSELEMVQLNINATLRLASAVIPQMKQRRNGAIVSVSSVAGFQPLPYMATYAATKAFNLQHSLALREELRPFGVKVLVVCPGPTATEFGGVARVPGEFTNLKRDDVRAVVAQSINALFANSGFVVPCFRSWCMSLASRFLPRLLSTKLARYALSGALKASRQL